MEILKNDPMISEKEIENLAQEIYEWLVAHDMWSCVNTYFNGIVWSAHPENDLVESRYDKQKFVHKADPRDYFDYVRNPHILSMSFDGELYELLNYGPWLLVDKFEKVFWAHSVVDPNFGKRHLYYEFGNDWNLSVCY